MDTCETSRPGGGARSAGRIVIRTCLSLVACALLATGGDALPDAPWGHVLRAHYLMGTVFAIEAYSPLPEQAGLAIEDAFQEIRTADLLMSHYRQESELSLLNQKAARAAVRVHPQLLRILQTAEQYNRVSRGAFDITTNSLTGLWAMAEQRNRLPTTSEIAAAHRLMGIGRLVINPSAGTIRFDRDGVRIDLGAIAKGWAVDRAAELLRQRGIRSALINAGSSTFYAIGAPPGQAAWRIAVQAPQSSGPEEEREGAPPLLGIVALRDGSLSTSASSERYFAIGGTRYSHVLDPRSGWPVVASASATVIARTATESDALSTAAFVLGPEQGARLLEQHSAGGLLEGQNARASRPRQVVVAYPGPEARVVALGREAGS